LVNVRAVLDEATLVVPEDGWIPTGGREGRHTEHLSYLLAEMQVLHRAYPGGRW
jgi:ring-1,2-phenylacetyl-CoA epoxidase subunit PaaC